MEIEMQMQVQELDTLAMDFQVSNFHVIQKLINYKKFFLTAQSCISLFDIPFALFKYHLFKI